MFKINRMNTLKRTKKYLKNSSYIFPSSYISLDFETTGLDPENDEIIEIGAVKIKDGKIIDEFSKLIKPKNQISQFITYLTGIDNQMVKEEQMIEDIITDFLNFIDDNLIIGQNVGFDLDFLYHALDKLNISKEYSYTDTLQLSLILIPNLKHHRLKDLVDYYEIENDYGYHRALGDCINTFKIYEKEKEEILTQYGSFDNFIKEPISNIDKKGVLPKKAISSNIRLVSNLKLRDDIINGDIKYFTNKHGLNIDDKNCSYDKVTFTSLLDAYSQDNFTTIYEKPFKEKKEIKNFLKKYDSILPNRRNEKSKMYITFSPMELSDYLELKKLNIDVCLSKDVIEFIRNYKED